MPIRMAKIKIMGEGQVEEGNRIDVGERGRGLGRRAQDAACRRCILELDT